MDAQTELHNLIEETISHATADGLSVDKLRGIAFFDISRDAPITSLSSFDNAKQAINLIPNFAARLGAQEAARAVLQFVYEYFDRVDSIRFEQSAFDAVLADFTSEIQEPLWVTRGLANVRNFTSHNLYLDLLILE